MFSDGFADECARLMKCNCHASVYVARAWAAEMERRLSSGHTFGEAAVLGYYAAQDSAGWSNVATYWAADLLRRYWSRGDELWAWLQHRNRIVRAEMSGNLGPEWWGDTETRREWCVENLSEVEDRWVPAAEQKEQNPQKSPVPSIHPIYPRGSR